MTGMTNPVARSCLIFIIQESGGNLFGAIVCADAAVKVPELDRSD